MGGSSGGITWGDPWGDSLGGSPGGITWGDPLGGSPGGIPWGVPCEGFVEICGVPKLHNSPIVSPKRRGTESQLRFVCYCLQFYMIVLLRRG